MSFDKPEIILVTGGSRYIDRNLIRGLVKLGCKIKALARNEASEKIVSYLSAEAVRGDLYVCVAKIHGQHDHSKHPSIAYLIYLSYLPAL